MSETLKQTNNVTYRGTYFSGGGRDTQAYRITLEVPHEVVKNQNVIGWFKQELKDPISNAFKAFTKDYPGYDSLCTHSVDNLEATEEKEV